LITTRTEIPLNLLNYNYIGNNGGDGVQVSAGKFTEIFNNNIGYISSNGVKGVASNMGNGIALINGANYNYIGKTNEGFEIFENTIVANKKNGIYIGQECTGNHIEGNLIGTGAALEADDAFNRNNGILIEKTSGNWIGGLYPSSKNHIVGYTCVYFRDTLGNYTYRNFIGSKWDDNATNVYEGIYMWSCENEIVGQAAGEHYNYFYNTLDVNNHLFCCTNIYYRGAMVGYDKFGNVNTNNATGFFIVSCTNVVIEDSKITGCAVGIEGNNVQALDIRDGCQILFLHKFTGQIFLYFR